MILFRIVLLILSCLLLGAHFLRGGHLVLMVLCLIIPSLLLIKKRWSLIIVQIFLFVGTWIWIRTAIIIIHERMILGIPWGKIVIIIGPIAIFTLLAGLLLNSQVVRKRYPPNTKKPN